MSKFREIYSTERFARVLAISQEFVRRPRDVERITLFTDGAGQANIWRQAPGDPQIVGETLA